MKHFNLDEYLKNTSREVVTREGKPVKIHCTNYIGEHPIIAQVEGYDYSTGFCKDGRSVIGEETPRDLFFAPEKHEGWVNIFPNNIIGGIYESEEEAKKAAFWSSCPFTTIKIEWEE